MLDVDYECGHRMGYKEERRKRDEMAVDALEAVGPVRVQLVSGMAQMKKLWTKSNYCGQEQVWKGKEAAKE